MRKHEAYNVMQLVASISDIITIAELDATRCRQETKRTAGQLQAFRKGQADALKLVAEKLRDALTGAELVGEQLTLAGRMELAKGGDIA